MAYATLKSTNAISDEVRENHRARRPAVDGYPERARVANPNGVASLSPGLERVGELLPWVYTTAKATL